MGGDRSSADCPPSPPSADGARTLVLDRALDYLIVVQVDLVRNELHEVLAQDDQLLLHLWYLVVRPELLARHREDDANLFIRAASVQNAHELLARLDGDGHPLALRAAAARARGECRRAGTPSTLVMGYNVAGWRVSRVCAGVASAPTTRLSMQKT